jgi:hypothetical protein
LFELLFAFDTQLDAQVGHGKSPPIDKIPS